MTGADATGVKRTAARAALAVPGVTELQPTLRQSLACAATRVRQAFGTPALGTPVPLPEAGIHAERAALTGAWHVDVRCVCDEDRRALDTARDVHDNVRAAVASYVTCQGVPGPVTIVVTVTRVTSPHPVPRPKTTAR